MSRLTETRTTRRRFMGGSAGLALGAAACGEPQFSDEQESLRIEVENALMQTRVPKIIDAAERPFPEYLKYTKGNFTFSVDPTPRTGVVTQGRNAYEKALPVAEGDAVPGVTERTFLQGERIQAIGTVTVKKRQEETRSNNPLQSLADRMRASVRKDQEEVYAILRVVSVGADNKSQKKYTYVKAVYGIGEDKTVIIKFA